MLWPNASAHRPKQWDYGFGTFVSSRCLADRRDAEESSVVDENAAAAYPADPAEPAAPPASAGASTALARLLRRTPFPDLHDRAQTAEVRGLTWWVCFILDLLVRVVTVAVLIGVLAGVAWKTLAPFPPFLR